MKTTRKANKGNWEGSDIFDRTSVSKAIPVDAKDGLIDIKWSENDRGYLVVFAPGSKKDVNEALKAFKKCGWSTEYETYKGYHVVCVRDKEWDGLTDESNEHNEMKYKTLKSESTEPELVNDEECGSTLYEIGLWWGSGYVLDMYKAYAFSSEEALNYVVAYVEKTHPKWLESSDECAENTLKDLGEELYMDRYEVEESPEFQEQFMYVDATSEGARKPHYIWAENLRITHVSSTSESKEKPSPVSIEEQERQKETRQVMNHLMNAEDEIYTAMTSAQRMAKYENNQATANSLNICASYSETALKNLSRAKLAIRDLKMNESTKKLVKEGAGAGYDIIINDVKIDKVLKFEESDYKSEYSSEKYYKYEASIRPGIYEIEANTYYDALTSEDDNQVTLESGTIYGEVGIWNDPDDERTLEEKIREEIEGYEITISTMYGGGWMHAYLPKDGNIEFDNVKFTPDSYSFTIDEFKFSSPEMATVINWNYDHIGEEDDGFEDEPEEVDESDIGGRFSSEMKDNGLLRIYAKDKVKLDTITAPEFKAFVEDALTDSNANEIVFDFSNVTYISAPGVNVLLSLIKKHKKFEVIHASKEVMEWLDMTGFSDMFKISTDESLNESLNDGFTTNKEVTKKVDELRQAVWRDAQYHTDKKVATAAFHVFERALDKAITDYWDFIND